MDDPVLIKALLERDALRLRLAEVERERDEALRDEGMAVVKYANAVAERDDARRVAKRLALTSETDLLFTSTRASLCKAMRTALAYEVEP